MGSEQYCLRWNNHQSNLLGVFSQLLKDESLVDVTLVCSEGTSIRAHKVVLSACSSYFQSLFLDHPDRHPIVILKDVRFVELRTLIEFMYKGEVNVQYCQLSELIKTAESLKVKGLVEMTNQNTAQREHEPPTEPEKLRSSTQLLQKGDQLAATATSNTSSSSSSAAIAAAAPTTPPIGLKCTLNATQGLSSASGNQLNSHTHSSSNISNNISRSSQLSKGSGSGATNNNSSSASSSAARQEAVEGARETSSAPYSLYQPYSTLFSGSGGGSTNNSGGGPERCHTTSPVGMHHQQRLMSPSSSQYYSGSSRLMKSHRDTQNMLQKRPLSADGGASEAKRSPRMLMMSAGSSDRTRLHSPPPHSVDHREEGRDERREEMDAEEEEDEEERDEEGSDMRNAMDEMDAEEERLRDTKRNIKLLANSGRGEEDQRQRPRSRQHHHLESDISSRLTPQPSGSQGGGGGSGGSGSSIAKSEIGRSITSILGNSTEISASGGGAGGGGGPSTSALPPMQQVPLSLKKEIDWDRADNKSPADFRHPSLADMDAAVAAEATSVVGGAGSSGGGGSGGGSGGGGLGGSGGSGSGSRSADVRGPSSPANSLSPSPSPSTAGSPGGAAGNNVSAIVYPCIYCTATFPSQNKQTRHILAHSLETLKFREIMNSGHIANLLPPPLPSTRSQQQHQQQQHFNAAALMAAAAAAVTSSRSHHQHHHHHHQQQQHPHQSQTQQHHLSPSASLMCPPGLESPIEGKGLAELAGAGHVSPLDLEFAAAAAMGPNLLGSGSLSSLHRSSSPRASSPGGNSMIMGRGHDGDGASAGSSGGGSGSGLAGSGSNSVVMCKFCGKSFPDVSTLITHLPVHTGDRPFKCEYCGKAFKLRHHMKDHCRVHTGERPFRCGLCGKTFSRSTILKAHEKTHYPKFVRKFLSPSPVDTRDDSSPQ